MVEKKGSFSRRRFLKTAGAVGIGSLISTSESLSATQKKSDPTESQFEYVPSRQFGKTRVDIPILGLGSGFTRSSDLLIKQALQKGVNFWDTARGYRGGNDEKAIGKYFEKYPEDRKKVFLSTKSRYGSADYWDQDLDKSLEAMNTPYIDLFLVQGVAYAKDLAPPVENAERWAEKAKADGKIRFFGFSTHRSMEDNLLQASGWDWIDGIMFSYNFRIMHTEKMKKAIDACTKAGIGLIAIKTQGPGWFNEKEQALFDQLTKKGLTIEQAKLKVVWDDKRIASICTLMPNMTILQSNVAAATDNIKLSIRDKQLLDQNARATASTYCAGCASICGAAVNDRVPISDVMRYLMYARCYGDMHSAKSLFNELPLNIREEMVQIDYQKAEKACPQRMQIGRLMREASTELA